MTTFALHSLEDQDMKESARAAPPINGQQRVDGQQNRPISFVEFSDWKVLNHS